MFIAELTALPEEMIETLIADHWKAIKGLIAEKRRRQEDLLNTDEPTLDIGLRDRRA